MAPLDRASLSAERIRRETPEKIQIVCIHISNATILISTQHTCTSTKVTVQPRTHGWCVYTRHLRQTLDVLALHVCFVRHVHTDHWVQIRQHLVGGALTNVADLICLQQLRKFISGFFFSDIVQWLWWLYLPVVIIQQKLNQVKNIYINKNSDRGYKSFYSPYNKTTKSSRDVYSVMEYFVTWHQFLWVSKNAIWLMSNRKTEEFYVRYSQVTLECILNSQHLFPFFTKDFLLNSDAGTVTD